MNKSFFSFALLVCQPKIFKFERLSLFLMYNLQTKVKGKSVSDVVFGLIPGQATGQLGPEEIVKEEVSKGSPGGAAAKDLQVRICWLIWESIFEVCFRSYKKHI